MINVKNNMIDARELHTELKSNRDFPTWIKEKIKQADLQDGKDFYTLKGKSTGGRPQINYSLTIEAAKELCLLQQTPEGHKLRRELIKLDQKVQDFELLTHQQTALATNLINCLKYVENMRIAETTHRDVYLKNVKDTFGETAPADQTLYKEFHIWRNRVLDIDKETLEKRIKEFCIANSRSYPKASNKIDKLVFMGQEFEAFRNAVFDVISAEGTNTEKSLKFAEAVRKIAEYAQIQLSRRNENTFFQKEEAGVRVSEIQNQLKNTKLLS